MSTLHRLATVCILGAALTAFISGCSSDSDTGTPGGAGSPGAAGAGVAGSGTAGAGTAGAGTAGSGAAGAPTGNAANGETAYKKIDFLCSSCHGNNGEGVLGPNITGNATAGIGSWTFAQFLNLVRTGTKEDGTKTCAAGSMPTYTATDMPDQTVADIFAYLKSKDNATANKGSSCP